MKVLFITRKHPPQVGGMEKFSYNLIKHFPVRPGTTTAVIALGRSQKHLIWFMPWALIKSLFVARDVDVVHIGDPVLSLLGWVIKRLYNKPVAVTLHGLDMTFANPVYQAYLKLFAHGFNAYIAISRDTLETAEARGFKNLTLLPVGVVIKKMKKMPLQLPDKNLALENNTLATPYGKVENPFVLLTVGRLVKRKGVAWFVSNVMPKLTKLHRDIFYFVAGIGPEEEVIISEINKHNLKRKVFMLGKLSEKELAGAYSSATSFVMPNLKVKNDMEGFGIVAIEAGEHGLPVIARGIEGITDAVTDNKNGTLIKELDPNKWVDEIDKLYSNPSLRSIEGERNRKYVRENFSYQKISEQYYQEFQKLL